MKIFLSGVAIGGFMFGCWCVFFVGNVYSGEMSDEMKRIQEQLNNQVLSQPFSVPDEAQVKAYIESAQKRGEVPKPYTGKHWRPGYTCANLGSYYREYLACRHYHHYYGRYYP